MKRIIRLTESDLHKIVKETLNRVLREGKYNFDGNLIGRATELLPDIFGNVECEGILIRNAGNDFVPKGGL